MGAYKKIEELRRREREGEPLMRDEKNLLAAFYTGLDAEEAVASLETEMQELRSRLARALREKTTR